MSVSILVVDDNPANLGSLEAILGETGAQIVKAHSGNDALLELLRRDFALILLDIQMPNMDGYETARLIRERDRSRHVPIIFLTAFNLSETNVLRGYSLGAVDYLFKPLEPEILRSKVVFFLELHAKNVELHRQEVLLRAAEKREHERNLVEAKQQYQRQLLMEEAERERRLAEAHRLRSEELERVVAERERAQRAMHRSHQRLELLADSAKQLLVAVDPWDRAHALCRRVAEHLDLEVFLHYGLDETGRLNLLAHDGVDQAASRRLSRLDIGQAFCGLVAERRERLVADADHALALSEPSIVHALGLTAIVGVPLLAQERLLGVVAFGTRLERSLLPDELSTLQAFCDLLAVTLDRAHLISALQEGDRRKDEFLAMLGHELRNPLVPIRNSLEIFGLRIGEDPVLDRALTATKRQVGHLVRLVDDLLDLSRITRGRVELRRTSVELSDLVEQAVHATKPLIEQRGQKLTVDLPAEPILLQADAARLAQVLANLLHNGSKYSPDGARISLDATARGGSLLLRVSDNGIGLRPEMLSRVFELFVQESPGSGRSQGGLGIGLTLVKNLVELHGGSVTAHSDGPGKGSTFAVRLPVTGHDAPRAPATLPRKEPGVRPLEILLVEDNADIRETTRDLLELYGHRVSEAADGMEGVEKALAERPRLALVDIGLPGLDGYGVAELVRRAANGAEIGLVALTGYGMSEARERALASGFDEHLVKPITAEDLLRVLRRFDT